MFIKTINNVDLKIKIFDPEDLEILTSEFGEISNTGLRHVDFMFSYLGGKLVKLISILKNNKVIFCIGKYNTPEFSILPSSSDHTVSFLVDDSKEGIGDVVTFAINHKPDHARWFIINDQLICEFCYND